jgi:outer membrane lipoprotein SlyB
MKASRIRFVLLSAALALATIGTANAAGCIKGAVVGGVAGHYAGHHAVVGAVGGCLVGRHRRPCISRYRRSNSIAASPSINRWGRAIHPQRVFDYVLTN